MVDARSSVLQAAKRYKSHPLRTVNGTSVAGSLSLSTALFAQRCDVLLAAVSSAKEQIV